MNEGEAEGGRYWTILVASMVGSAGLAIALGQDGGFDLLNYHYYSGYAFLHKPFGYDFGPAQIQSFHNPLLHVLSYLTLGHLSAKAAAALLGAVQGLNFYLAFRISQILFPDFSKTWRYLLGLGCAGAGFYGIASTTELGATYGDNVISILVLTGLALVLPYLQAGAIADKKSAAVFAAAGFLAGAAFGLKSTAAIYLLGLMIALPLTLLKTRGWGTITIAFACGSGIGFLATYGFWGLNLYLSYQNPFFPYLNKTFHSPYFDLTNFFDDRFLPANWQQVLFYPFFFVRRNNLVSEIEFRDVRLALCYLAIVLLCAAALARLIRRKPGGPAETNRCLLFLALFFAVSYVSWLRLSSIYRYLSVLELLAPAFLALTITRFLKEKVAVLVSSAALIVVIVASAVPISFGRMEFTDDLLKLKAPGIQGLDQSVVLMTGYEPISYIVPSFPKQTRFVRISSTFVTPGRNRFLDAEIKSVLARYDKRHTFAYIQNVQEIGLLRLDASAYGTKIDAQSCFEIRSRERKQSRGYLCGVTGETVPAEEKPVPELRYSPKYIQADGVPLSGGTAGKYFDGRVKGVKTGFVDLLYELDGEMMPAIRRWQLDSLTFLHLGPWSRNGNYRIIGIRDSGGPEPDSWIPVNVPFSIKGVNPNF